MGFLDAVRANRRTLSTVILSLSLSLSSDSFAKPSGPSLLCESWPDVVECRGRVPSCTVCHRSTWPPSWNDFGIDVLVALSGKDFETGLGDALDQIAASDPDGDGVGSLDELQQGTAPGAAASVPGYGPVDGGIANPGDVVDGYDNAFAYRRIKLVFCGESPRYDEVSALAELAGDAEAVHTVLHETLDECLAGDYWRTVQVPRMAHRRIRPIQEVGANSSVGIVIGDYEWDYRLFRYVLTGGRDLRDLLTATYHVDEIDGELVVIEGPISPEGASATGNPLPPERRAGMLTTRWFFAINTMFSALPRTAAAQAYREYLGMDLALSEGILPVQGEPIDVDNKGVAAEPCSHCHTTLDPLSYAFAEYNGIAGATTGNYNPQRPSVLMPGWDSPQTVLLGAPVNDLVSWAQQASESAAFRTTMVTMLFELVLDREPEWDEVVEVMALTDGLADLGYSADALLHSLVDTFAFGAP